MDMTLIPIVGDIVNNDPTIHFTKREIVLSRDAVRLMGLKSGDRIMVVQNKDRGQDLYLRKSSFGVPLKLVNRRMIAYSRKISRAIKDILGNIGDVKYIVEPPKEINGEMMYPIFTRRNLIQVE